MPKGIITDTSPASTPATPNLELETITVGGKPGSRPGIAMTPEQRRAVQEEMNTIIRCSAFGQAYVDLLNNPKVSITIGNTGGALGTTDVGPNNTVKVQLSQREVEQTYGELLAKGYSAKEAVHLTALKMVSVQVHELQHAKNDLAQINILGTSLTATPREEEATGWAAGAAMYRELLSSPNTGPALRRSTVSLDGKLQTALSQWNSGLASLERERGWKGTYSIRNREFDKMMTETLAEPVRDRPAAQRVVTQVTREEFGRLADYYNQEYARLTPHPK